MPNLKCQNCNIKKIWNLKRSMIAIWKLMIKKQNFRFFFFQFIQSWFLSLWYKLITCMTCTPNVSQLKKKTKQTSYMYFTSAECWHIHIMSSKSTWKIAHITICVVMCLAHMYSFRNFYRFIYLPTHQQCKLRYIIFCVFAHLHTTDKSECMYT